MAVNVRAAALAAAQLQAALTSLYRALDELNGDVELEVAQLPPKVIEARDRVTAAIISVSPILGTLRETAPVAVQPAEPEPAVRMETDIPVDATLAAKVVAKVKAGLAAEPLTLQAILL